MSPQITKTPRNRHLSKGITLPRSIRLRSDSHRPAPQRHLTTKFLLSGSTRCKRKFLKFFPNGFYDETYLEWERGYKFKAHEQWNRELNQSRFRTLLGQRKFSEVAAIAVRIESRTNLLFSFEKMALRDAVKSPAGARAFAYGLYSFLHGPGSLHKRFENWCHAISGLPRRQTRVLTWPMVTIFGFIAQPAQHIFLKPMVTKKAAQLYGFDFQYKATPSWPIYENYLKFAAATRKDLSELKPRDQIDIQSFLWVLGSEEYD